MRLFGGPPFENHLKIHRHFYRAHACVVNYFLMTEKFQHIRIWLKYPPSDRVESNESWIMRLYAAKPAAQKRLYFCTLPAAGLVLLDLASTS